MNANNSHSGKQAPAPSIRYGAWLWWLIGIAGLAAAVLLLARCRPESDTSQDRVILEAARRYGVDPALVKAVVWRESSFDPNAKGNADEVGLMQVGDLAAHEWADAENVRPFDHHDLFDPARNTLAGTWYLRKLIDRYRHTDGPLVYALADYNAGRTHVLRWAKDAASTNSAVFLEQMDFPGTRRYIESILEKYAQYQLSMGTSR